MRPCTSSSAMWNIGCLAFGVTSGKPRRWTGAPTCRAWVLTCSESHTQGAPPSGAEVVFSGIGFSQQVGIAIDKAIPHIVRRLPGPTESRRVEVPRVRRSLCHELTGQPIHLAPSHSVASITCAPLGPSAVIAMLHAASPATGRIAAVLPVTLLSLFIGLLWLIGLACNRERREYVEEISDQAMRAISSIWQSTSRSEFPGTRHRRQSPAAQPGKLRSGDEYQAASHTKRR
jgi:hypothetical protein